MSTLTGITWGILYLYMELKIQPSFAIRDFSACTYIQNPQRSRSDYFMHIAQMVQRFTRSLVSWVDIYVNLNS